MTWFRVDDGFWSHPKSLTLSSDAVALWTRAGSYCGKHLTDGYVPRKMFKMLQATDDAIAELIEAELWEDAEDGWQFHDWLAYQDSREDVEKRRDSWKKRQQKYRKAMGVPKVDDSDDQNDDASSFNHSIPFHSRGTGDSRKDSRGESRRDKADDRPTPTPPPIAEVFALLDAKVSGT